jgi:hypothetical protein
MLTIASYCSALRLACHENSALFLYRNLRFATLDWLNRNAAFKIAKDVPYRLLEAVSEHRSNVTAPTANGLLYEGKVHENADSRLELFSTPEPTLNKADS